ncbi:MAG: cobyric acid synthase, partial [Planctomycetota bacterium]
DSGVEILEKRSGVPVLGVLPWIKELNLPEEDAVALNDSFSNSSHTEAKLNIAVVRLPHIANFDDFDPLAQEPGVHLRYVRSADEIGAPDVLMLPGTKNTIGDLQWLRDSGLADRIVELADRGTRVVGICGGYQMLGRSIHNPDLLESPPQYVAGLALLEVDTTYHANKQTRQSDLIVADDAMAPGTKGSIVSGYEIHVGRTESRKSWLQFNNAADQGADVDGAYSRGGQVWGCYLHGLFHNDRFRKAFLRQAGVEESSLLESSSSKRLEESLDRLANAFEESVDVPNLIRLSEIRNSRKETHV